MPVQGARPDDGAGPDSLVGTVFGNYTASELLGSGAMGEIYLGVHPEIGRRVAIKVLSAGGAEFGPLETRFLEEARVLSSITHPNVIDIYDFGRLPGGKPYYVMELLQGRTLGAELERVGSFSMEQTLPLVRQICQGLQVVHVQGVVHRDLKPENIFLTDAAPPALKLLDFGLAKMMPSQKLRTGQGIILGTPVVIAPEQASGRPAEVGPPTDIYSLGVVMFWMLAGRPPFDDEDPGLLLARHICDAPPDLQEYAPSVPGGVAELVARCLEKEPGARPESAAAVLELLDAALEPGHRSRPSPPAPQEGARPRSAAANPRDRTQRARVETDAMAAPAVAAESTQDGLPAAALKSRLPVPRGLVALVLLGAIAGGLVALTSRCGGEASPPGREGAAPAASGDGGPVAAAATAEERADAAAPGEQAAAAAPRKQVDMAVDRRRSPGRNPLSTGNGLRRRPRPVSPEPVQPPPAQAPAPPPVKAPPKNKEVGEGTLDPYDLPLKK